MVPRFSLYKIYINILLLRGSSYIILSPQPHCYLTCPLASSNFRLIFATKINPRYLVRTNRKFQFLFKRYISWTTPEENLFTSTICRSILLFISINNGFPSPRIIGWTDNLNSSTNPKLIKVVIRLDPP